MRIISVVLLFLAVSEFGGATSLAGDSVARPNILLILTDDQGWPTLSCYGNQHVETTHLDRLAAEGIRFTDAYVMPQCTPTRAALLTGQHTARNGMWHVIGWYGSPWARMTEPKFREQLLPAQCRLPHLLRQAGYRTGMAGKWHLTNNEHGHYVYLNQKSASLFGFDYVAPPGSGSPNEGDKWVNHLTDAACDFIETNRNRPWFFYLSHHTLHNKVTAPQAIVAKYRQQGAPAEGHFNATYLAAIEHLDSSVGRLLKKLDDLGLSENTLVIFLSDNGGIDTSYNLPAWADQPLDGSRRLTMKEQQFDNAPLRQGKGSLYEGGIRVPCVVRWPAAIQSSKVDATPIHVVDWLPTLLAVAKAPVPDATDGVDLSPIFRMRRLPERTLYWYAPLYDLRWAATPAAAARRGPWKLVEHFGDRFDGEQRYRVGQHTELFNLRTDVGETTNLVEAHPEIAAEMRKDLIDWIKSIDAELPERNPHYDRSKAFFETKEKQPWNR